MHSVYAPCRSICCGVATVAAALACAPSASAATVADRFPDSAANSYDYAAAEGEENNLTIRTLPSGDIEFSDSGAVITVGENCESQDPSIAVCEVSESAPHPVYVYPADQADFVDASLLSPDSAYSLLITDDGFDARAAADHFIGMNMGQPEDRRRDVYITGGGGDDRIELLGEGNGPGRFGVRNEALGDPGDDVIIGSNGSDAIFGGDGKDLVRGGASRDFLTGEFVYGGPGADGLAGDRAQFEDGDAFGDVELTGGPGNDSFVGREGERGTTTMYGGPGDDDFELLSDQTTRRVPPLNDPDFAFGQRGTDHVRYRFCGSCNVILDGSANDGSVEGPGPVEGDDVRAENITIESYRKQSGRDFYGPGRDRVVGNRSDNVIFSGFGPDRVVGKGGRDDISTYIGADVVIADDGDPDRIRCGPGPDRVRADARDVVARDCEDVRIR